MRYAILAIMFLIVAAIPLGCTSPDGNSAVGPKPGETAAEQLDVAKAETIEAGQAVQDYAYAQKAEFIEKMKIELAEIQKELDRLYAKVEKSSGAAKADAKIQLDEAREKWVQAKKQLDQAENASESTWDDVQNAFKKSYADLKDAFERARQWTSDKIEP